MNEQKMFQISLTFGKINNCRILGFVCSSDQLLLPLSEFGFIGHEWWSHFASHWIHDHVIVHMRKEHGIFHVVKWMIFHVHLELFMRDPSQHMLS